MSNPPRPTEQDHSRKDSQEPEWLKKRMEHASEGEKKLWHDAYSHVHDQNHYMKGEGPYQALSRLKEQHLLPDLAVGQVVPTARDMVKKELGANGEKHRDYYTTKDNVLSADKERNEVTRMVEQQLKAEKEKPAPAPLPSEGKAAERRERATPERAPERAPERPPERAPERPPDPHPAEKAPDPAAPAGGLLKSAIERAKAEGRPLNLVQLGDSMIVAGIETPALAQELERKTGVPVQSSSHGEGSQTVAYALKHPDEFMKNIDKNTDLVVVSFGVNGDTDANDYRQMAQMIRDKAPNATIVQAGPVDADFWKTNKHLPYLDAVNAAQEQSIAGMRNAAHVDVRELGAGRPFSSLQKMKRLGLSVSDNLHLTDKGYQLLGTSLADYLADN